MDVAKCTSPVTFMSNMMYACSILYKTELPFVIILNKSDIVSHKFALEWMRDYESFLDAINSKLNTHYIFLIYSFRWRKLYFEFIALVEFGFGRFLLQPTRSRFQFCHGRGSSRTFERNRRWKKRIFWRLFAWFNCQKKKSQRARRTEKERWSSEIERWSGMFIISDIFLN